MSLPQCRKRALKNYNFLKRLTILPDQALAIITVEKTSGYGP